MNTQSSMADSTGRADRGVNRTFWIVAAVVVVALIAFYLMRHSADNPAVGTGEAAQSGTSSVNHTNTSPTNLTH